MARHQTGAGISLIAPFALRLHPGLKARVDEEASRNQRSVNAEIAHRVERSFSHEGPSDEGLLRDHLAMATLTGILSCSQYWPGDQDAPEAARRAYAFADAMLAARGGFDPSSTPLLKAAKAILVQWDTPNWKLTEPTAELMQDLRHAVGEAERAK